MSADLALITFTKLATIETDKSGAYVVRRLVNLIRAVESGRWAAPAVACRTRTRANVIGRGGNRVPGRGVPGGGRRAVARRVVETGCRVVGTGRWAGAGRT
jgi:hypothetical protein